MVKIGVIGLGYVGLPLAVEFGKDIEVIGFDINTERVDNLKIGFDVTRELTFEELSEAKNLKFSSQLEELQNLNHYIITVPTPVDESKIPDLQPLIKASEMVGKVLKKGDLGFY